MTRLGSARGEELLHLLLSSPPDQLHVALMNQALSEDQLVATLRRRDLLPDFLSLVARNAPWTKQYLVKVALVMNPRTPKHHSMNLVKFLFWRDLVKVLNNYALEPPVRVSADKVLSDRLEEMELGEKIALARIGSREVVKMLRRTRDERIFAILLFNPRLTEDDLLPLSNNPKTPARLLDLIGRNPRWGTRYLIRLALVRNPTTPSATALKQLQSLNRRDLRELLENPHVPRLIRRATERALETLPKRPLS